MTIYDIAAEAKVSISTVSRVLNSPEKVSKATCERVRAVLNKYNYTPNAMARGLVYNSMKTVGVLMPDIRNLHFSASAYVLESFFFAHDYTTLLCNTGDDLEKKQRYVRNLAEKKIDGLILIGSIFHEPEIENMIRDYLPNTPVVISNSKMSLPNTYSVLLDQIYGAELLIEYLVSKGYENIYFVRSNNSYNAQQKIEGFIKTMKKHKLPLNTENNIFNCDYSMSGVYQFAKTFEPLCRQRTVCIFYDDYIANCGANAFRSLGLAIPEDVAIVGFDNSRFSQTAYPQLTTIDTKVEEIASIMANMLHNIIMKNPVGNSVLVNPELIVRDST